MTTSDPRVAVRSLTSARKEDHVRSVLSDGRPPAVDPGWDDVHLVPRALPSRSLDAVDLGTDLLGHGLGAPLLLAGMTGGFPRAEELNATLGYAAERFGLAVGVGSQRAALAEPDLEASFAAIRRHAPTAPVIANLGAAQLVAQDGVDPLSPDAVQRAIDMVGADALAIHLNLVQELVQPEGDRCFDGLPEAIAEVVASVPVPVVVKETGAGLDRRSATELVRMGVSALDVGGAGGTSFARVEATRGGADAARLGALLEGWGIPTAASILEARGLGVPVIATGGVRTGLDAARALALGADLVGVGRPVLAAAAEGRTALVGMVEGLLDELRVCLLLAGASGPADLAAPVLTGSTLEWGRQRSLL